MWLIPYLQNEAISSFPTILPSFCCICGWNLVLEFRLCMCVCVCVRVCVCVCTLSVDHSCPALWEPMDCSPLGFSVHGISQERMLEWVAISFPGDLPGSEIETALLVSLALGGRFATPPPYPFTDHYHFIVHVSSLYKQWRLHLLCNCLYSDHVGTTIGKSTIFLYFLRYHLATHCNFCDWFPWGLWMQQLPQFW